MEINTLLIVAIGVFLLWLGTTDRLKYIGPAWNMIMSKGGSMQSVAPIF